MRVLIAIVGGFGLMWPLGWLFGEMNWPFFHGWALAHGTFMLAWPLLSLLLYVGLRLPVGFSAIADTSPLFKCGRCGAGLSANAVVCPSCGHQFARRRRA